MPNTAGIAENITESDMVSVIKQELDPEPLSSYLTATDPLAFSSYAVLPEDHLKMLHLRRSFEQKPEPQSWPATVASTDSERRRRRHANESEEQRRARLARDAQRRREARMMETEEEAQARRAKEAAARRHSRQYRREYLETEEEARARRQRNAEKKRLQRQLMSSEQVSEMRRRGAARQAEKRRRLQELKGVEVKREVDVHVHEHLELHVKEEPVDVVGEETTTIKVEGERRTHSEIRRDHHAPPPMNPELFHPAAVLMDVKPTQFQVYPHHKVYPSPNFYH